ncbi:MAG: helix-turn-helix domain-containing protein [Actinobacteria bacterium]|nr:helix-turn-helix domain-containing protein [Actinomycetota bacterium]
MDDPHNGDATAGTPEARLGSELRRLRVQAGLSVRALARTLHRSHSGIVEYERGRRLAPVEVVEQYEQFFALARGTLGAQRERARLERLQDPRDATLDEHLGTVTCPYMGLRAFEHDDAPLFFGRETQVEQVLTRLREARFMAVIGASGSGKSSFVQAGLVAGLIAPTNGEGGASVAVLTPGAHPIAALADAVNRAIGGAQPVRADALIADPGLFESATRRARSSPVVIAVDQLEELFTICRDEDERCAFIDALSGAWRDPASPVVVIVALRSDFYGRMAAYPQLAAAVVVHQTLLGPMSPDELRRAIEQPAARSGLTLQRGLVETILEDLVDEPAALPLLSHALLETWKRRRRLMLTVGGYHEAGGVRGAIAQTAERTLQSLDEADRLIARRILLRLTEVREGSEPTRRRVDRSDLTSSAEHPERLERVVGILADARLISIDDGTVVVAHEALIRHWPRLRGWIDADRAALLTHSRLTLAAREWDNLDREAGALYRGARLATALEWARDHGDDLSERERAFLVASRAAEERDLETAKRRTRRLRALSTALAALTFVVAAVSVVAIDQRDEARRQADEAMSLALVSSALPLVDSRPDVSLLLAFEAYRASPRVEARNAVRSALAAAREPGILSTLHRHAGPVTSVAFGADQRTLASAGSDNTIRIWDVRARKPIGAALTGHTAPVTSVAFSRTGRTLASGSADNTVRLWNVRTRKPLGVLRSGHNGPVTSIAFSRDANLLASASNDNTIRLWDARTQEPVGEPLVGHRGAVTSVTFSRDGRMLASGSVDETIRLWDRRTGKAVGAPLTGHRDWVASVAFSPTADTLASAGNDKTIRLWNVPTRTPLGTALTGHMGAVTSVAFSSDGRTLASASTDKMVRLWDARARKPLGSPLRGHTGPVSSVAFNRDGRTLASAGLDRTVRLWDARSRARLRGPPRGHTAPVQTVAFVPGRRVLASGSDDGTILLWDAQERRPLGPPLVGHTESVESVAFDHDGRTLASAGFDRSVRLWDTRRRRQLGPPLTGHTAAVTSVAFSPDRRVIASAGFDKAVRLWDIRGHRQIRPPLVGHTAAVSSVAFSADGATLASAGEDKAVVLWDVGAHRQLEPPLIGHNAPVSSVAVSPDGRTLASAGFDGTVRLWDAVLRKPLGAPLTGHTNAVRRVAFSPDGRTLASASSDKTIRLWDVRTRRPIGAPLTGHDDWVMSVAFSGDGRTLASSSNDRTVRLWQARAPRPLNGTAPGGTPVTSATFSRRSHVLPAAPIDGSPRRQTGATWRDVSELRAIVCNIAGSGLSRVDWTRHAFGIPYRRSCP